MFCIMQILEEFLVQNGGDKILVEYKKKNSVTDEMRRKLIVHLAEYVLSIGGDEELRDNCKSTIRAALSLFPCFKFADNTENIVRNYFIIIMYIISH
jgi:hypothetical protein